MRQKDVEKNALRMARKIHKIIEQGKIGIIGGTVKEKNKETNNVIRLSDRCLFGKDGSSEQGFCNKNVHFGLNPLDIQEFDIPFCFPIENLQKILSDISYASGLSVANPVVRLLMYQVLLENLYTCTLRDLEHVPRLPVFIWVEPETPIEMLSVSIEDFRVREVRPSWCLRLSSMAKKCDYFTRTKDGYHAKLSPDKIDKYLSNIALSYATGEEWHGDFATIIVTKNPLDESKKIVAAGGNHWLGTLGANAVINLVTKIPEKGIIFRNTVESMAWLGEVSEKQNLENYQVMISVTYRIGLDGKKEIDVYITGVFALPS